MRAAAATAGLVEVPPVRPLRRAILRDAAGKRLGEVPLDVDQRTAADAFAFREAAAQVLVAVAPNWTDRPSTGDAMQVVIGRRACFGYLVDAAQVRWFSHPRLAPADAFSAQDEGAIRRRLYGLHAADPETVSEIIWETSGRISVRPGPVLPAGIDPRGCGSPEREGERAAWLGAMAWRLLGMPPGGSADPRPAQGRRARSAGAPPRVRGGVS